MRKFMLVLIRFAVIWILKGLPLLVWPMIFSAKLRSVTSTLGLLIVHLPDGQLLKNMKQVKSLTMRKTRKGFVRPNLGLFVQLKTERTDLSRILQGPLYLLQHPWLLLLFLPFLVMKSASPFVSAPHDVSRAPWISAIYANNTATGEETALSTLRPPAAQLHRQSLSQQPPQNSDPASLNDKYSDLSYLNCYSDINSDEFTEFISQVHYFEQLDFSQNYKGVKGRLAKNYDFWVKIGANDFVLDTIKNGYVIPFLSPPPSMFLKNNKSALSNAEFVNQEVKDLVDSGCVYEVPFTPYVVNPLSVAINKSNKKRLILDLSILNKYVKKERFKFEDWRTALQMFNKNSFLFKFDLKSGYHHFDICPQQQTFLGFCWNDKFYCFSVLVFGLSSSPHIFTKCLRTMVKHWRKNAIDIVLYLDDGFGMASSSELCLQLSNFVKKSLSDAGFLINVEKSIFCPTQQLEWLGILWNSNAFSISIPDRRVNDLLQSINHLINIFPAFSARLLAQVTGKIISLSPVFGNLTRLMTRYCYMCIEQRFTWDKSLLIKYPDEVKRELEFWKNNVEKMNSKFLSPYSPSQTLVYSDASDVACGAYTVEIGSKVFHKMWNPVEKSCSSTWREMRAIELSLQSFSSSLTEKSLKWFTDNQNCVHIVQAGSMKEELQKLAFSIYTICKDNNIVIDIQWIPRIYNAKADYISKMIDHEDWQISGEFFNFLNDLWGPFTCDRFASDQNKKVKKFNSLFWNPSSDAVDAFTQDWSKDNNWLVPPIYLVIKVIKHLIYCKAKGSLIVPRWVSAPYWSFIFNKDLSYKDYVQDVLEFRDTDRIYIKGSSPKCIFGTDKLFSTVLAVRLDASL